MKRNILFALTLVSAFSAQAQTDSTKNSAYADTPISIGFGIKQPLSESTMSVATSADFNHRSSKNIGNSLFGEVLGITTLQGSGDYSAYEPTFYVRGLQGLNGSSPLIVVDGIERRIENISPEEVERVVVLKDAPATALYGYKGSNGVINIVTKRGQYNSHEIKFTYDHAFNWEERRPDFVNAYDYAKGLNEAYANDGLSPRYSANELEAFKSGKYPYYYPNVDWIAETFRNHGASDIFSLSFRGGGSRLRYYTEAYLVNNTGFIKNANLNSGYSTQNKYQKGNIRTNLDIDLTSTTQLAVSLDGILLEASRPGLSSDDLWGKIYTVPAAAYPIKTEDGLWGGNATWSGLTNPVALTEGRAYSKGHTRALFADATLTQNLSAITKGLSAWTRIAYDNIAAYWENHTRTYRYGMKTVTGWKDGEPSEFSNYTAGTESNMSSDSKLDWQNKNFNWGIGLNYDRTFGEHSIQSVLMWNYEYRNWDGQNNTQYRTTASWYNHYGFMGKYFADLSLSLAQSNKLAPGHRTAFDPTFSVAWLASKENFLKNVSWIDFLKLRASWGIVSNDYIPGEGYWEQVFTGGGGYPMGSNYDSYSGWKEGRLAALNTTHEKAAKYNLGLDGTFFHGLNLTLDGYFQHRYDEWVASSGKNSSVAGVSFPYVNGGIVNSWGFEAGAQWDHEIAPNLNLKAGANYTLSKSKIKEEYEEPREYDYLKRTGQPVGAIFGYQAIGFFKDQADIDNSPVQRLGTEPSAGDIKFKDQNGDGVIDEQDQVRLGYNTSCPEIYYSFNVGLEYKGLGFYAMFQGVANYTAYLNTTSIWKPLVGNANIGQYYYDHRWTPETAETALYPRLSSQDNQNNYNWNSIWLANRNFLKLRNVEIYYIFPKSVLAHTHFINKAKLYLRGVDLLCFDKIKIADPENYGANYPLNRSVNVGLALGF
jgi:TonB-linked SusC/RagA family outer membrane protein